MELTLELPPEYLPGDPLPDWFVEMVIFGVTHGMQIKIRVGEPDASAHMAWE